MSLPLFFYKHSSQKMLFCDPPRHHDSLRYDKIMLLGREKLHLFLTYSSHRLKKRLLVLLYIVTKTSLQISCIILWSFKDVHTVLPSFNANF